MRRHIDIDGPQRDDNEVVYDPKTATKIINDHLKDSLRNEMVISQIADEKSKQQDNDHHRKELKIQRVARRAMLGLAALLSFGAVGDAMVPDTPEYMGNASRVELAIFHNETDPIELLGIVIPLLGGAAYTRRRKEDGDEEEK